MYHQLKDQFNLGSSKIQYLFIIGFAIGLLSCGNSKKSTEQMEKEAKILTATIGKTEQKSADFTINKISISDNIMTINLSFSGGCKEHDFQLIGSEMVMKSYPAKRPVVLLHHSNGDECEKLITKEIQFDISNLAIAKKNGEKIYLLIGKEQYLYEYKLTKK